VVALVFVLFTTRAYPHTASGIFRAENSRQEIASSWDWREALVRAAIITISTIVIYLAASGKLPDEKENAVRKRVIFALILPVAAIFFGLIAYVLPPSD
jgi:hypothetical protein